MTNKKNSELELKKSLGQHFLKDAGILEEIAEVVKKNNTNCELIAEVGPGMGALTQYLYANEIPLFLIEKDDRFVRELPKKFPNLADKIYHTDVLEMEWQRIGSQNIHVVGNFPYNISTQIVFNILENWEKIAAMTGMFQKEVAKRIASSHGTKDYGMLSVLAQNFYEVTYCFDIAPEAFDPPPKVVSGIVTMRRRPEALANYPKLKMLVKAAFNQRRKTLNNSLKGIQWKRTELFDTIKHLRPEQLSVEKFFELSYDLL